MLDFLSWCVTALGQYIQFLSGAVLFDYYGPVSLLGFMAAVIVFGMLIRSLLLVSR